VVYCSGLENHADVSAKTTQTQHFCEFCDAPIALFAHCSECCDGEKVGTGDELYFIQSGSAIKIGRSLDASARIRQLQTGNPSPLKIVARLPYKGWQEPFWHYAFKPLAIRLEWFLSDASLLEAVAVAARGDGWAHLAPYDARSGLGEAEWRECMIDAFDNFSDRIICLEQDASAALRAAITDEIFGGIAA